MLHTPRTVPARGAAHLWPTCAAAALGALVLSGVLTPVHFATEHIRVRVSNRLIEVVGRYHYRNTAPWPTALRLAIPFPVDDEHLPPLALAVDELDGRGRPVRALHPAQHGEDTTVRLFFWPRQERHLRIHYLQPSAVPKGTYILTTTWAWKRPLEHASFELLLPEDATLVDSSFALEALPPERGMQRFAFERSGFWPAADWKFAWKEAS